jgi:glucose-6-phosphate 1-epimerase
MSLYGGHILSWQPKSQSKPVLWLSDLVKFQQGKAIRGGVPICWPWFGAHTSQASLPGHGFARITHWDFTSVQILANGATVLDLSLGKSDLSTTHWHGNVRLKLRVTIGDTLEIVLMTMNESKHEITFTEGLHTYFHISDIENIRVQGLEGSDYIDLVNQNAICKQEDAIEFDGELGRIFLDNQATCFIEDPAYNRCIKIEKKGSNSTAVWNPGFTVASKMDDMSVIGWREMVCVESASAMKNKLTLAPTEIHTHTAIYSVRNIK